MKGLKQCMRIGLRASDRWPNARFGPKADIFGSDSKQSVVESETQWAVDTSDHPSRLNQKVRSAIVYIFCAHILLISQTDSQTVCTNNDRKAIELNRNRRVIHCSDSLGLKHSDIMKTVQQIMESKYF